MRVLVTGADGFVGGHLVPALSALGWDTLGTTWDGRDGPRLRLPDDETASAIIREFEPTAVIHLAAVSAVPEVERDPAFAWRTNVEGTASIHRSLRSQVEDATFLHVSSGAVYGAAEPGEGAVDEHRPCRPTNAYAWSKLAAESWLRMHSPTYPGRTIIVRPFNHVGPGQSPDFALSSFARQIVAAERGESPGDRPAEIRTGNLDVRRDFLDVRDVTDAYRRLLEAPEAEGTYNLASGKPRSIRDLLEELRRHGEVETRIVTDQARVRRHDPDPVMGSPRLLMALTGWRPRHELGETCRDLLEDWRRRLAAVA